MEVRKEAVRDAGEATMDAEMLDKYFEGWRSAMIKGTVDILASTAEALRALQGNCPGLWAKKMEEVENLVVAVRAAGRR